MGRNKKKPKVNTHNNHQNYQRQNQNQNQNQSQNQNQNQKAQIPSAEISEDQRKLDQNSDFASTETVNKSDEGLRVNIGNKEIDKEMDLDLIRQDEDSEMKEQKDKNLLDRIWPKKGKDERSEKTQLFEEKVKGDIDLAEVGAQLKKIRGYVRENYNKLSILSTLESNLDAKQSKLIHDFTNVINQTNQCYVEFSNHLTKLESQNSSSFDGISNSLRDKFSKLKNALSELDRFGDVIGEIKRGNGQLANLRHDIASVDKNIQGLSTASETLLKDLRSVRNKLDELPDVIDQDLNLSKRLKGIENTTEMIQGTLQTLQNQDQSEIKALLQDKTILLKKEFPAMNEDEETIIELAKYSEFITEQLTVAARHYARNRQVIEEIHQERNRHGQELKDAKAHAHQTGLTEGKRDVVKELLSNYHDVHALFESPNEEIQILMTFLKNHGLSVDENLSQGAVLEITDDSRHLFDLKASFNGLGNFKVEKPAYLLNEAVHQKAVLVPYFEEVEAVEFVEEESAEVEESSEVEVSVEIVESVEEAHDDADMLAEPEYEDAGQANKDDSDFVSTDEEEHVPETENEQPLETESSLKEIAANQSEKNDESTSEPVEEMAKAFNEEDDTSSPLEKVASTME